MEKLKLYLDTSVISHLFHEDTPERKADTEEFFRNAVRSGTYEVYISEIVIKELQATRNEDLRRDFLNVPRDYGLLMLPQNSGEIVRLASLYISQGIIPSKKPADALHIAYATFFETDVLVTWNFRHMARARTTTLINTVSLMHGYGRRLELLTPLEVMEP